MSNNTELYSGRFFNYDNPRSEDVCIEDIAHGLSNTCRFNGQCRAFYSVAEHSIIVSRIMADRGAHAEYVYAGLMHDAAEAYIGDLPTPLKRYFAFDYKALYRATERCIERVFDIRDGLMHSPGVVEADQVALAIEAHWMMPSQGEHPEWHLPATNTQQRQLYQPRYWDPNTAERMFIEQWNRLATKRHAARVSAGVV